MRILFFGILMSLTSLCSGQSNFTLVQLPLPEGTEYRYAQVEPSIAIHPKKQNIMIAGSVLTDYYYSKNGGKSWKSKKMESPYGVYGDPVTIFDEEGRVYYFHLASYNKTSHL
ncbi:MAG: hypothetical protein ACI865_000884, partial [Flavobacteriaceae bacterium]